MNNMKNKKIVLLIIMYCMVIGVILTLLINLYMIFSTKSKIVLIDELNDDYQAILILGCKVENDTPSLMLYNRLEKGYEIYDVDGR